MDTSRSFLDNLNAGRKRRSGTALEHISRTLQEIEKQLDLAYAAPAARPEPEAPAPAARSGDQELRGTLKQAVSGFEESRRDAEGLASIEDIASEIRSLRGELQSRNEGVNAELATLRAELENAIASGRPVGEDDVAEALERLSSQVAGLVDHGDDSAINLLRLDMEELRAAIASLAREETVRAVGARWDEFASAGGSEGEMAGAIGERLGEITQAVLSLPDGQALRSLEDKVRGLAGALDQFIEHSSQSRPELHELIDDRLDEISRAIAATAAAARQPHLDTAPFERIEARVASLSRQVEEIVEETQSAQLLERLNALALKVDEISSRLEAPDAAMAEMASQIAAISQKVEQAMRAGDPEAAYRDIDERFETLAELVTKNHGEAMEHGDRLFDEVRQQIGALNARLESTPQAAADTDALMAAFQARFDEFAERLDARSAESDDQALVAIETRLEELTVRLKDSFAQAPGLDPQIVRELQKQISELAGHLAQPMAGLPEFEDLGPRLARIERSLAESRESVVDAARRAAEETLASLRQTGEETGSSVDLSAEIKALETLAKRSDDRNARTFEAIHDTLLKIVERLSAFENGEGKGEPGPGVKLALGNAPSLDPAEVEEDFAPISPVEDDFAEPEPVRAEMPKASELPHTRTPAEAAAAAAEAALSDVDGEAEPVAPKGRRSMLGGLTRAFSTRKDKEPAQALARKEPTVSEEGAVTGDEPTLDAAEQNAPLEPGSGAPDLNAIMRRVRDDGGATSRNSDGDAAKADFIAAARRAAQAAAAEAETLKRKKSSDARGGNGRFGVGGLLRSRKTTAMMAVAGIAIAAGGFAATRFTGAEHRQPVKTAALVAKAKPAAEKTAKAAEAEPVAAKVEKVAAHGSVAAPAMEMTAALPKAAPAQNESAAVPAARSVDAPTASPASAAAAASDEARVASVAKAQAALEEKPQAAPAPDTQAAAPADEKPAATEASLPALPETIGTTAFRQALTQGDAKALFAAGDRYTQGQGVEANATTAAGYYREAAEAGLAPAQYRIGNDYEKGIGVERDIEKARGWYEKAAAQGNASAMHNLGVLYAMGAMGKPDNDEAARWFVKAADLGVRDSQFNLGILSAKGVGVKRDLQEAYKWFALVAKAGDGDAAAKRDEIGKALDADGLKAAKAKAELWKAKPVDPAANFVDLPPEWTTDKATTASVDMKKAVTNIQLILNKSGYSAGPADGMMGAQTKSAIMAFQKDNGMDATGDVDGKLVKALLARN